MINKIQLNNVRGITNTFSFKEGLNIIEGRNGTGKSTLIQSILDSIRGEKIQVKDGDSKLFTGSVIIERHLNKLFSSPKLNIDLSIPGFLMGKGKTIKGVNATADDRRLSISNLLGISKDKFFTDKGIDYNISGLVSEIKKLETIGNTYVYDLMELESTTIDEVIKPVEVKLIPDTVSNEHLLISLKDKLSKLTLQPVPETPAIIEEVHLIETKTTKGNYDTLARLKEELESIVLRGKNIKDICPTCNQKLLDTLAKDNLREEYLSKKSEIDNFKLIDDIVIEGNNKEYIEYRDKLNIYLSKLSSIENIKNNNLKIQSEIDRLNKEISEFVLVDYVKGNEVEYNNYTNLVIEYNRYLDAVSNRDKSIKDLTNKIKNNSSVELKSKLQMYKEVELEYLKFIDTKLTIGDLRFIFYKRNISSTSENEFSSTFTIEYKGIEYNNLSGGERGVVDCIIASIFARKSLIDFIIIDNAEISIENINILVNDYLNDLQVIVTRISNTPLQIK